MLIAFPNPPTLAFLGKSKGTPKNARVFFSGAPKIHGKERKNAQKKQWKLENEKKARKSKKQGGLEGQGCFVLQPGDYVRVGGTACGGGWMLHLQCLGANQRKLLRVRRGCQASQRKGLTSGEVAEKLPGKFGELPGKFGKLPGNLWIAV